MNADGSSPLAQLTRNISNDYTPQWSPDGNKITFASDRTGNFDIYVMSADGSGQVNLTDYPFADDALPDWSPDGNKIAFCSNRSGYFNIYVMNADSSNVQQLTHMSTEAMDPTWSPDGSKIAFMVYVGYDILWGEIWDIYTIDVNGSNLIRLTQNALMNVYPDYSPDGQRITFSSNRASDNDVFVMNGDGSQQHNLTYDSIYQEWYSAWSPDGTKLAYTFDDDRVGPVFEGDDIYIMNPDGTQRVNLTSDPTSHDRAPSWGIDSRQTFTIYPVYPTAHTILSTVMQGGIAYRHFRLTDSGGSPIPNATIALSTGETALSDASGYFTATISADGLGGLGNHTVSVQSVTYGGQTYTTNGQPSFSVKVTERRYSHAWGYGASSRFKGGISAGLIAYLQQENSGGLELTLDESDPSLTLDDVVLMEEDYSDEVGAGAGVGLEKGVNIVILQIKGGASAVSERYIRTLGSTTARFPSPYESNDKKAQAIFLLASVLDSLQNAFPGKPFGIAVLRSALDLGAPYQAYIVQQQAGTGAKITPLQVNVGVNASLGLKRGGGTWKERILGFDLIDVGVTVLTLDTFTDYRDRDEIGLSTEVEFDLDFSALSWQIGDFREKFAGTIGEQAKKIRFEIILNAGTGEFKRLELSLIGEGNPYAFTDVVKEEVTVKAVIPADQLTEDVLLQTVNVLRLLQAIQQTGNNPLRIGSSAMVNELNALLAPIDYAEYEVTVDDGARTNYETSLGVTLGIDIELGPGLEVKKTRSLVRERGVFVNGHPYVTESYNTDGYVSQPGKGWWDLTTNALGGLWEYVKDFFSWVWQQVTSGVGWVIGVVSRTVGGVVWGGAQVIAPPGTQLYAAGFGSQETLIQQTGSITITAVGWVPTSTASISSLGLGPTMVAAAGDGFVVGGIYEFQPYTLTMSPAATLVITYTDEAAAGTNENHIGMFQWNSGGNNWHPMTAMADTAHNVFTATITQLGTFALGYDGAPPGVSILSPANGSTTGNSLPLISALVVDTGVGIVPSTVQMRLGGRVVAADYITGTGQVLYLPEAPLANGTYTVTVSAADVMGNTGSASATFTVEVIHCLYLPVVLRHH